MGTKLVWIRDCWSLFVMNLHPATTTKNLFFVFREAGPVFDVFVPKDKNTGRGRGFGFVCFKTEWNANRAIQRFDGRVVGGRRLGVQKAKFVDRKTKNSGQRFYSEGRRIESGGAYHQVRRNLIYAKKRVQNQGDDQVWIEGEGDLKVVKVADSLVSSLNQEVCDSFVATVGRVNVSAGDIHLWLLSKVGIQAEIKKLKCLPFWIKSCSQEGFSQLLNLGPVLDDSPIGGWIDGQRFLDLIYVQFGFSLRDSSACVG